MRAAPGGVDSAETGGIQPLGRRDKLSIGERAVKGPFAGGAGGHLAHLKPVAQAPETPEHLSLRALHDAALALSVRIRYANGVIGTVDGDLHCLLSQIETNIERGKPIRDRCYVARILKRNVSNVWHDRFSPRLSLLRQAQVRPGCAPGGRLTALMLPPDCALVIVRATTGRAMRDQKFKCDRLALLCHPQTQVICKAGPRATIEREFCKRCGEIIQVFRRAALDVIGEVVPGGECRAV